jgi:hypothetical protein
MAVGPPDVAAPGSALLHAPVGAQQENVHVHTQLEVTRQEVLEARKRLQAEQQRLEDLLEAQMQLERLLLPAS